MTSLRKILATACLLSLVAGAASASEPQGDEILRYSWRLEGFLGTIARLVFPGSGDGRLSTETNAEGRLETELLISSPKSERGEFWLYGAEVDPEARRTLEVWNAYKYREKDKEKRAEVEGEGVIDFASGILLLRQDPPTSPRPMKIWSDGKIYPVTVVPGEFRDRTLGDGSSVRARVYRIRGEEVPGQGHWKGKLDLWFAQDDAATPVEILVERTATRVRLRLVGSP